MLDFEKDKNFEDALMGDEGKKQPEQSTNKKSIEEQKVDFGLGLTKKGKPRKRAPPSLNTNKTPRKRAPPKKRNLTPQQPPAKRVKIEEQKLTGFMQKKSPLRGAFVELKIKEQKDRAKSDGPRDTNASGLILDHKHPENPTYRIGKVLGSGMIGVACLCQDIKHRQLKCLKYMSIDKIREKNLFKNIKDEVQIMYELIGVEGVCQIEDIIINEEKDITLVLPFYALTDLWNYMKVLPGRHLNEKDSRKVFLQLVSTFQGIHERQIMHRDIKPENILVKNDELDICLSDFGLATRVGPQPNFEKTRTGQAGTPCYYSYEIVRKIPYDERVDIWCLGVLLFEMLFGALPFSHAPKDARDYSASITSLHFRFPSKSTVSQEARDLIAKILVEQDRRITLEQIKFHPWIKLDLDLVF